MSSQNAISVSGLTKSFDKLVAVDHVDLDIGEGEFFGLLGPNGAGKTTLIRMLVGLCVPTSGKATILGRDIVSDPYGARELIGVVPQDFNFDDNLTAKDILTYHAGYFGMPKAERNARADELLAFLEIGDKADTTCTKLSGGMKRRLLIGRALMTRPKVLFLDEPTTGVDVQLRHSLWDMFRKMEGSGTTLILTTHYIEEADSLCDRVAIMDHGRIIALGSPEELKKTSSSGNLIEIRDGRRWHCARPEDHPGGCPRLVEGRHAERPGHRRRHRGDQDTRPAEDRRHPGAIDARHRGQPGGRVPEADRA